MSTNDPQVQLGVGVDTTSAKVAFREVKESARNMAQSVADAGQLAGKGVEAVGDGGAAASGKVDRATKSIIASIQRATAAAEAGSTSNARYFESIAAQRGIGGDALRPYLAGLDAAIDKQRAAAGGMGGMAISAGQMQNALRGVPAQFTDIATSLMAGQAPMTVLLQQGGQLKDMFGGAGEAARAMGGYIVGLINPFTVLAATAATVGLAYAQGSAESQNLAKALILTGNAAGQSAGQLQDMAKAVAAATGTTQSTAANAIEQAVTAGKIAGSNLAMVSEAAVRMERATGQAISKTVDDFSELGKEPVKASEKLNEKYNYLTGDIYKQIRALEEQGKTFEAGALAQKAYADALNSRSKEVVANLGLIEEAWKGIVGAAARGWDAMLGVGRKSTLTDQIAEQKRFVEAIRSGAEVGNIDVAQKHLAALESLVVEEEKKGKATAESNRQTQASNALAGEADKYLSKEELKRREILKLQNLYVDAVRGGTKSTAEITQATKQLESALEGVEEKYREREKRAKRPGKSQDVKDAEELLRVLEKTGDRSVGLDASYYKDLRVLFKGYQDGRVDLDHYRAAVEGLTTSQKFYTDEVARQKKAQQDADKAMSDYYDNWQRYLVGLDQEAAKLEDQVMLYGLGKSAMSRLTLARAEDTLQKARDNGVSDEYLNKLEQEVELRKRIYEATATNEVQEANTKAAEKAAQEWQRVSDDISRALTDSIFRGGKTGWQQLKSTIEATLIRAYVQPVVQGAMNSMLGMPGSGAAGAGAGGGGAMSSLGSIGNLFSTGSKLAGLGSGLSAYEGLAGYMQFGSMASSFGTGLTAAAGGADLTAAIAAYEAAGMGATAASLSGGAAVAGSVGAEAASMMGAAMSGLAAAAPYLAVALLVANQLGAFKGATPHRGGAYVANTNGSAGQLGTSQNFGGFDLGWGAYNSDRSSQTDTAMMSMASGIAQQIATSATRYGGAANLSVGTRFASDNSDYSIGAIKLRNTLGQDVFSLDKHYDSNASKGLQDFVSDSVTRAIVGGLKATDLADQFDALFKNVDPLTSSLEDLNKALSTATTVSNILALTNADASKAAAAAGKSATEQFYAMSGTLATMAQSGVLSMDTLLSSTQQYYDAQVSMIANLNSVGKSVSTSIEQSIRNIKYGLLDSQGQYNMLDSEAARYMDTLRTLTDPTLIQEYAGKLTETINTAYQLTPEGLRADQASAFIDRFQTVNDLVQARLSASKDQVAADNKALASTIADAITKSFGGVQDSLDAVSGSIPKTIDVVVVAPAGSNVTTELGY